MAFSLEDLHTPKNVQELEAVVLFPFQTNRAGSGTGSFSEDVRQFEEIIVYMGLSTAIDAYASTTITKYSMANSSLYSCSLANSNGANYRLDTQIHTDGLGFDWLGSSNAVENVYPLMVVGYRRKFSTTPISKTIDLGTITAAQEIVLTQSDIGSEFFNPDGTIKDSVKAEVWVNNLDSANGSYVGWGQVNKVAWYQHTSGTHYTFGTEVMKRTDGIVIRTGEQVMGANPLRTPQPFGYLSTSPTSIEAKVIVSMGERYAPTLAP